MCLANIMNKKNHKIHEKRTEIKLANTGDTSFQNIRQIKERKIIFKNIRKNTEKELLEDYFTICGGLT